MKRFRFYMKDGSQIEQEGYDFREAVQNQGFSDEEVANVERWEEV
jgi:hypothetical protein